MLYVLGGASRSGKTLLARRAVAEKQIPYFPLDSLFNALVYGAPQFGLTHKDPMTERATRMWPIGKHFFDFFFREEKEFLIEGDSVLPIQIKELMGAQKPVKSCFLGYIQLAKEEKLNLIRNYHQGATDWTNGMSDVDMLIEIEKMIEFSKYLEDECLKYGIKYFDVSHDFEGVRNEAFRYLFAE